MDDLAGSITDGRFNEQKVLYSCPLLPLCMSIKMRTQMEIIQSTPSTLSRVSISEDVYTCIPRMFLSLSLQFRLKNCGVKCPIYLVEEFGDKMHLKLPVRSLEQAISNTLVSHVCVCV